MIILFILISILILNPYTLVGPLGYYVALPIFGCAVVCGIKYINLKIFFLFFVCIVISTFGVLSSVIHSITQFEHLKVAISILIYYFIGIGLYVLLGKNLDIDDLIYAVLCVGVFNGVVILLQVQYPQFRAIIESLFVGSGNIDWTEGFRYRGLASGGGASLSVLSAVMVYICLYLYGIKKIGLLVACSSLAVLIFSVFFIGRTGVLLIVAAFVLHSVLQGWRNIKIFAFVSSVVVSFLFFGLEHIKEFLTQEYGEGFYNYSLGFLLEGKRGIESEGTIGLIGEFLTTVPKQFPEILIGYGFYGGSEFYPWTDSGYARMFLSVGFLFGIIFYGSAFCIFKKTSVGKQEFFWPLILLLAIAEMKEGMMFAGYSSRLLFILLGFWAANKINIFRQFNGNSMTTSLG